MASGHFRQVPRPALPIGFGTGTHLPALRTICRFISVAAAVVVSFLVLPSAALAWSSTYSQIADGNTGFSSCLDVTGGSSANGTPIQQWSCNGDAQQQWALVSTSTTGYFEIVNENSGSCLDVTGASSANGTPIQQWSCDGGVQQLWTLADEGSSYELVNDIAASPPLCLDVTGGSTANGTPIQQWSCNDNPQQNWSGSNLTQAYGVEDPTGVHAYYMYSSNASALTTEAYNDAYYFAQASPHTSETLILDFGAARDDGSSWGACDFTKPCTLFSNAQIQAALQAAARGYHAGHSGSATAIIVYGNTNYEMTQHNMSNSDAYNAGYSIAYQAVQLYNYQTLEGYTSQGVAAGTDMEPLYDKPTISLNLTAGLNAYGGVWGFDYGSADECPTSGIGGSCANGWSVANEGTASFSGDWWPLPQIYDSTWPASWSVIRNTYGPSYVFWGVTGGYVGDTSPETAWEELDADNPGHVAPNLVCFGGC